MSHDVAVASDILIPRARLEVVEHVNWKFGWLAEKWSEDAVDFARKRLGISKDAGIGSEILRKLIGAPDLGEAYCEGNLLLNEGIQLLLDLLIGAGGTVYSNANAQLGVGDSATAESASQTDLQAATNKTWKAMNATFPSRASQTLTFQSDFLTGDANYVWNEGSIRNGAAADKNLNRKVASLGTKTVGTWTLTGTVTVS